MKRIRSAYRGFSSVKTTNVCVCVFSFLFFFFLEKTSPLLSLRRSKWHEFNVNISLSVCSGFTTPKFQSHIYLLHKSHDVSPYHHIIDSYGCHVNSNDLVCTNTIFFLSGLVVPPDAKGQQRRQGKSDCAREGPWSRGRGPPTPFVLRTSKQSGSV